jgi:integrase
MKKPSRFYNLESKKNLSGEQLIFFNMAYGYKSFDVVKKKTIYSNLRISSKWAIQKEYWDTNNFRANKLYVRKFGKDINNALDRLENTCFTQLSIYREIHEINPSPQELKELIQIKLGRIIKKSTDISIVEFITKQKAYRTKLPTSSSNFWSFKTGQQYDNLIKQIERYEKHINSILTFETLTEIIYWDFYKVINDLHFNENKVYYTTTTIAKVCKHLRTIFNSATEEGLSIGINYSKKSLKIHPTEAIHETFLTEQQLEIIINNDASHSAEYTHAKNYIIISSFLGLRIEDMVNLHELTLEKIPWNSKEYDCIITKIRKAKKNNIPLKVAIPILQPLRDFLGLNGNKFPVFPSQPNIRKVIKKYLAHLKFNDLVETKLNFYLQEASVKKMKQCDTFTPHDCRATFITNLRNIGVSHDTIEPITHPRVKSKNITDAYDKSLMFDKMVKFIDEINSKKSSLFRY